MQDAKLIVTLGITMCAGLRAGHMLKQKEVFRFAVWGGSWRHSQRLPLLTARVPLKPVQLRKEQHLTLLTLQQCAQMYEPHCTAASSGSCPPWKSLGSAFLLELLLEGGELGTCWLGSQAPGSWAAHLWARCFVRKTWIFGEDSLYLAKTGSARTWEHVVLRRGSGSALSRKN